MVVKDVQRTDVGALVYENPVQSLGPPHRVQDIDEYIILARGMFRY